jgi:hypothetical protein
MVSMRAFPGISIPALSGSVQRLARMPGRLRHEEAYRYGDVCRDDSLDVCQNSLGRPQSLLMLADETISQILTRP